VYLSPTPLPMDTMIRMEITRNGKAVFEGSIDIGQMKRSLTDLVSFLYRECSFPAGSLLMTGTGLVPTSDVTLLSGDRIVISVGPIGTLVNTVE